MRIAKELIGKPIYSISEGHHLGAVKDVYLDLELGVLNGLYLGSEGLIKSQGAVNSARTHRCYGCRRCINQ